MINEKLVKELNNKKKTIAFMESCTGGALVNEITNVEGASKVLRFSVVTYANDYKIKMGVSKETIDKYSVYSQECAEEMSKVVCRFANSNLGVGVTGKFNKIDEENLEGKDDEVFISIYDKDNNKFYFKKYICKYNDRIDNKKEIIKIVFNMIIDEVL